MERMKYPMAYIGQVLRMMKALLVAYVMTGFFLLITAGLMYRFELSEGKVKIAVIGIYVLSCFTGGFLAGRMMKNRKFLWGSLLGFLYFAVMLTVSVAVGRELKEAVMGISTTFFICIISGMIGGIAA
ncbi:TIGR04086 family membrane protein [Clostridiaceae bacterium Marseille-Q4145]|nr:TIGR04086 family membrane protein [Clostridiaceae bacterium Marseille-Q4145]